MNWIEACKSGKKFKRPDWNSKAYYLFHNEQLFTSTSKESVAVKNVPVIYTILDNWELVEDEPRDA